MASGKTTDTAKEIIIKKQEENENDINALMWLRSNPTHEKAPMISQKLGLREKDIQALNYTKTAEDEKQASAIFNKVLQNVKNNRSVETIMKPSEEELEMREQRIETAGKVKDVSVSPLSPEVEKSIQESGPLGATLASAIKGVTLGKADDIIGFGKAVQQKFINQDPRDFEEIFEEERSKVSQVFEAAQKTAPVTSEVVETAAAFGSPVTRAAGAVVGKAGKIAKLATETGIVTAAQASDKGEDLAESFKEGALVGAGTGLLFKGVGGAGKAVGKAFKKIQTSAIARAVGAEAKTAVNKLSKSLKRLGMNVDNFGDELAKMKTPSGKPMLAVGDTIIDTAIKSRKTLEAAGQKIGDVLEKAEGVGIKSKTIVKRLANDVINPLLKSGNPDDKVIAKKLSENIKSFFKKYGRDKVVSVKDLQAWRQRFAENVKEDSSKAVNRAAQKFDKTFRKAIEIVMNKAEKSGKVPEGFKQAKKEYAVISSFIDMLEKEAAPVKTAGVTKTLSNLLVTRRSLMAAGLAAGGGAGLSTALIVGAGIEMASRRAASTIVSLTKRGMINKIANSIKNNIGASGKFRPLLNQAAKMGPKALVGAHLAISDINKEYRNSMEKAGRIKAEREFKGRK